jgi:hypothetical protein
LRLSHVAPQGSSLAVPPYKYMHYYRTELKNNSDRALRIIWFEGYTEFEGSWYPYNVREKILGNHDFLEWYSEGDEMAGGVLPSGARAVCDPNWHGRNETGQILARWVFIAVDGHGNDYQVAGEVPQNVMKIVVGKD